MKSRNFCFARFFAALLAVAQIFCVMVPPAYALRLTSAEETPPRASALRAVSPSESSISLETHLSGMEEETIRITLPNGEGHLVALKIKPASAGPHPAVILVHGHESSNEDPALQTIARQLVTQGYAAVLVNLRNQPRGTPDDSSGSWENLSPDANIADIGYLAQHLQQTDSDIDLGRTVLIGHSFGGFIVRRVAGLAHRGDPRFNSLKIQVVVELGGMIDAKPTFLVYLEKILSKENDWNVPYLNRVDPHREKTASDRAKAVFGIWKSDGFLTIRGQNVRYWFDDLPEAHASYDLAEIPPELSYLYLVGSRDTIILHPPAISPDTKRFQQQLMQRGGSSAFEVLDGVGHLYSGKNVPDTVIPMIANKVVNYVAQHMPAGGQEEVVSIGRALERIVVDQQVRIGLGDFLMGEKVQMRVARLEGDNTLPIHSHPHDEYYLILSGEGLLQVGLHAARVGAGDLIRIPAGQPHTITRVGGSQLDLAFFYRGPYGRTLRPDISSIPTATANALKQMGIRNIRELSRKDLFIGGQLSAWLGNKTAGNRIELIHEDEMLLLVLEGEVRYKLATDIESVAIRAGEGKVIPANVKVLLSGPSSARFLKIARLNMLTVDGYQELGKLLARENGLPLGDIPAALSHLQRLRDLRNYSAIEGMYQLAQDLQDAIDAKLFRMRSLTTKINPSLVHEALPLLLRKERGLLTPDLHLDEYAQVRSALETNAENYRGPSGLQTLALEVNRPPLAVWTAFHAKYGGTLSWGNPQAAGAEEVLRAAEIRRKVINETNEWLRVPDMGRLRWWVDFETKLAESISYGRPPWTHLTVGENGALWVHLHFFQYGGIGNGLLVELLEDLSDAAQPRLKPGRILVESIDGSKQFITVQGEPADGIEPLFSPQVYDALVGEISKTLNRSDYDFFKTHRHFQTDGRPLFVLGQSVSRNQPGLYLMMPRKKLDQATPPADWGGQFRGPYLIDPNLLKPPGVVYRRMDQPADPSLEAELLSTGMEEAKVEDFFDEIPATNGDAFKVAVLVPVSDAAIERLRADGFHIYRLKPEKEPFGLAGIEVTRSLIQAINPDYLMVFVNERVDERLLDPVVTPNLKGIASMGLGYGNFTDAARKLAEEREIKLSYVGNPDSDGNVLSNATAEMAETLLLTRWYDLLHTVVPATATTDQTMDGQLAAYILAGSDRAEQERREIQVADLLWAQMLRQMKRIDEAAEMAKQDKFRGAGNGAERTILADQLTRQRELGEPLHLGMVGSLTMIRRWIALAEAHGLSDHLHYYSSGGNFQRLESLELGVSAGDLEQVIAASDYLLRGPGAAVLEGDAYDLFNGSRNYSWQVDPSKWALNLNSPIEQWMNGHALSGRTIGFYGLGSVGGTAAKFFKPFGVNLVSAVRTPENYQAIAKHLGLRFVSGDEIWRQADAVVLALPESAGRVLTPEMLNDPQWKTRVIANIGRGKALANSVAEEAEIAQALWDREIGYATDVLLNEMLPWIQQPFSILVSPGFALVTPHIASNAQNPRTKIGVRGLMEKTAGDNLNAMIDDKEQADLPNPIPALAGQEEKGAKPADFIISGPLSFEDASRLAARQVLELKKRLPSSEEGKLVRYDTGNPSDDVGIYLFGDETLDSLALNFQQVLSAPFLALPGPDSEWYLTVGRMKTGERGDIFIHLTPYDKNALRSSVPPPAVFDTVESYLRRIVSIYSTLTDHENTNTSTLAFVVPNSRLVLNPTQETRDSQLNEFLSQLNESDRIDQNVLEWMANGSAYVHEDPLLDAPGNLMVVQFQTTESLLKNQFPHRTGPWKFSEGTVAAARQAAQLAILLNPNRPPLQLRIDRGDPAEKLFASVYADPSASLASAAHIESVLKKFVPPNSPIYLTVGHYQEGDSRAPYLLVTPYDPKLLLKQLPPPGSFETVEDYLNRLHAVYHTLYFQDQNMRRFQLRVRATTKQYSISRGSLDSWFKYIDFLRGRVNLDRLARDFFAAGTSSVAVEGDRSNRKIEIQIAFRSGQEEIPAAEQRVQQLINRLNKRASITSRSSVVVIGPSIYQSKAYSFLPAFVENYFGPVRDRIFFDPDPGQRLAAWETQFGWDGDAQSYQVDVEAVQYLGSVSEQSNFIAWKATHLSGSTFATIAVNEDPVQFLTNLLKESGLAVGRLPSDEMQQLRADLLLLVSA